MAKKVVASLQSKDKQDKLVKVVKAVRSPKSGQYTFAESMVPAAEAKEYAKQ
jgi:hypothetical protein